MSVRLALKRSMPRSGEDSDEDGSEEGEGQLETQKRHKLEAEPYTTTGRRRSKSQQPRARHTCSPDHLPRPMSPPPRISFEGG
jgi:hypothetical protein